MIDCVGYLCLQDQVAELKNGSVLMTSRNFYGGNSGQGPRLFARSDDGGATWAANWSFTASELPGGYCEGSIISDSNGTVYFGHPGLLHSGGRANYTVHKSFDGGRTWPSATLVTQLHVLFSNVFRATSSFSLQTTYSLSKVVVVPAPPVVICGVVP